MNNKREGTYHGCVAFDLRLFTPVAVRLDLHDETTRHFARLFRDGKPNMRKKRVKRLDKQLNVRVSNNVYERLEYASGKLGTLPSGLVRMIIAEKLPEYEDRARKTDPPSKGDDSTT